MIAINNYADVHFGLCKSGSCSGQALAKSSSMMAEVQFPLRFRDCQIYSYLRGIHM